MAVYPSRFQHIFPATWITMNGKSAAFADVAANSELPSTELLALWTVDIEMSF
jgi:hypothetical protein